MDDTKQLTPEEAEDIFAAKFARILVDQILEQKQNNSK